MTTVFISGSMAIKHLDHEVKLRIKKIAASGFAVVVGDADGVDASIQSYLSDIGADNVTIYCSGTTPRNNIGNWPIRSIHTAHKEGSRQFFTAKDLQMADIANYGLMVWDAKSAGTLNNIIELLTRKKKSLVYVNKTNTFYTVTSAEQVESLISNMTEASQKKADQKIGLKSRISKLKSEGRQAQMFA